MFPACFQEQRTGHPIKEYNSEQGERGISLSALLWLAVSKTFCFGHCKVKQLLFHFF